MLHEKSTQHCSIILLRYRDCSTEQLSSHECRRTADASTLERAEHRHMPSGRGQDLPDALRRDRKDWYLVAVGLQLSISDFSRLH